MRTVVDLFAGPGGWDLGARWAGLADPVGVEWCPEACATRAAAGLPTIRADVGTYQAPDRLDLHGLIASPPCPSFSSAGKKGGVHLLPSMVAAIDRDDVDEWKPPDGADDADAEAARLTLSPLRWVDRHWPEWVAFEQVPAVLPVWHAAARSLERRGWSAWAGVLNAADYGVPQKRRRAILIGSRVRTVQPPAATHAEHPAPSLFGELLPWVSMFEAIGADEVNTGRNGVAGCGRSGYQTVNGVHPAPTVTGGSGGQWHLRIGSDASAPPTIPQGLTLQSFPPDWPISARTQAAAWRQIGNAVPPLLACHVLAAAAADPTWRVLAD